MPSLRVALCMTLASLALAQTAFAVDPFTILAVGSAAVDLAQTVKGHSKDLADVGDVISALDDLAGETLPNAQDQNDPYRLAEKIRRVERAAIEAGYTKNEIDDLLNGYRQSNSNLAQGVRLVTRSVRLGKRMVALAGISPDKASKVATLANAQNSNQESRLLNDILGQMVNESLEQRTEQIERERAQQREFRRFRNYVVSMSRNGNLAGFRIDDDLVKKAVSVYQAYAWVILSLVAAIFFSRVVLYQLSLAPAEKYTDLIRDTLSCYFIMLALPYVYGHMSECADALSTRLGELLQVAGSTIPDKLVLDQSGWPWWLRPEILPLVLYAIVNTGFNLVLAVLIALGPIAVILGTMLNFAISLPAYFALLLFVWLWPVFWNVLGYFKNLLWIEGGLSAEGISSAIASLIFFALQLLSPLAIFSIIKRTQGGHVVSSAAGRLKGQFSKYQEQRARMATAVASSGAGVGSTALSTASKLRAERGRRRQGIKSGKEQHDL